MTKWQLSLVSAEGQGYEVPLEAMNVQELREAMAALRNAAIRRGWLDEPEPDNNDVGFIGPHADGS